jgi:hypothetical protein
MIVLLRQLKSIRMKKVFLSLLIATNCSIFSQNSVKDIFTAKSMVWYGLDFSEAKMIGQFDQAVGAGMATPGDLKTKWIPAWNSVIISEPKIFKIKEAFKKDDVFYDIASTEKQNQTINSSELMTYNPYSFKDAQKTVSNVVSKLTGGEKTEGIGVVFVVESFDKSMDEATVYVTIFDIKTKSVLVSEKIIGKPVGIGLRNFWAGAIKHIIKEIDSSYYHKWKSKA